MTDKIRSYASFFPDQKPISASDEEEFGFRKWHVLDSYLSFLSDPIPLPVQPETTARWDEQRAFARQCLEDVRSVLHYEPEFLVTCAGSHIHGEPV
jgi:hypothetical protein